MKKISTFFAALACVVAANAADNKLTFYIGETPIENGSTVYFNELTVTEPLGDGWAAVKYEPHLYVTADFYSSKISVTAKCTTPGESIMMCCGGACSTGSSVTKDKLRLNPGDKLGLEFHWENPEIEIAQAPAITTEFEATDASNKNQRAWFTLVMDRNAGVGNVAVGNTMVSIKGSSLAYSVQAPSQLALFSIVGKQVINRTVNGDGTIALDGLAKGCYIYSLGGKTGKILVK